MPRLFRQSPVNGVWEGSGNVICLDVLRALARQPDTLEAYWSEVGLAGGGDSRLARAVDDLHVDLADAETLESRARSVVERMALVFQASLLVRFAPEAVAEAFCGSRLAGPGPAPSGPFRPGPTPSPSWNAIHRCEDSPVPTSSVARHDRDLGYDVVGRWPGSERRSEEGDVGDGEVAGDGHAGEPGRGRRHGPRTRARVR